MEPNPYESPPDAPGLTSGQPAAPRKALRVALHSLSLAACVAILLYAMATYGVLAWVSATPVTAEQLEQIQWWTGAWLVVIMSMLAGCVVFGAGIMRELRR